MREAQVGKRRIKITFFRVRSGFESEVVSNIREKLENVQNRGFRIFKVFGHFDLILIYEPKGQLLFQGVIPHVLSSIVFECFTWQLPGEDGKPKETFDFSRLKKPLLGIIFSKIKPSVFQEFKADVDLEFMKLFSENKNISALGSFGWSDSVVLVSERSIVKLVERMDGIAGLYVRGENTLEKLALKTYSFISVNFDDCNKILDNYSKPEVSIKQDPMKEVFAKLDVSCRPESFQKISESCEKTFETKPIFSFRENDIVMEIKMSDWASFLIKLIKFRRKFKKELFSTRVHICYSSPSFPPEVTKPKMLEPCNIEIDSFLNIIPEDDFGRVLLDGFYTLNQCAQNELVTEEIRCLVPFAQTLIKEHLSGLKRKDFDNLLQLFQTAIDQRLVDAYVGTENTRFGFKYHQGGIQKVLTAVEVIPRTLLSGTREMWKGFVVIGSAPDYRHDLDIINLPGKFWRDPTAWWGLFHETGHVYALYKPAFSDDILERFTTDLSIVTRTPDGDYEVGEKSDSGDCIRYFLEIVADAFDYRYGFILQEDSYIKTVWKYLLKEHNTKVTNSINGYIQRTLCALLINNKDINKRNIFKEQDIKKLLEDFLGDLKEISTPSSDLNNMKKDKIIECVMKLKPFIKHVAKTLSQEKKLLGALNSQWEDNEFKEAAKSIREGYLYTQKVPYPHLFILDFVIQEQKNPNSISQAAKVALIKTLWYQSIFHST